MIRPLENGGFHYVSNRITDGDYDAWWYTKRLTAQEWEAVYAGHQFEETGGKENESRDESLWYLPQAEASLLTETEREALKNAALAAAEQVSEVYQNMEIEEGASYASNVKGFSEAKCKEVVALLGEAGFVSTADNTNMYNYQKFVDFYAAYLQKHDAMVTVYDVRQDGLIGALTFVYRNSNQEDKIQTYYIGIGWQEGGEPKIKNTLISDVSKMHLTEKGYFIYTYEEQIVHSDENQYLRVKPLSEKCRELTRKYIYGLSFVNYNAFATNWDSSNVDKILMPCMFEDIYRIDTGTNLKVENDQISAEVYERIMMTYFPVSEEQLRASCGYDANSVSYPYEMIFAIPHAPFGEVVSYTEHADGTITLYVDGVWIDYNSDCAFTSEIVVQPFADGTFRYLSNRIQPKELELPTTLAPVGQR
ncbi:MAG: ATP F0F1 synthase subunit B [Lachnospiraceae bacterium]|nr:ATP F0F1 synthase subunit B [Lachnospiraceae bacterium]